MKNLIHFILIATITIPIALWAADRTIIAPDGDLILKSATGSVVVDSPAPGMVPIGGMMTVMPTTHASAWQPPATGEIKDGFMRADGHTITAQNVLDGSIFPEGTSIPNMVNQMARGGTTSGSTGGADSVTITSNNLPTHTHPLSGTSGGGGAHNHGMTAGGGYVRDNPAAGLQHENTGSVYYSKSTWVDASNHTHSILGTANNNTTTNTAISTLPSYQQVVWVIRVK